MASASKWTVVLGLLLTLCGQTRGALAQTGDAEPAIRQAVRDLLDSWREVDAAKGDAALHPDFRLTTRRDNIAEDDTSPPAELPALSVASREAMLRIYAGLRPGAWDDQLSDTVVHWDPSGLATLWARYRFTMDGQLTHCGAVSFTLYELHGRWRIIDFADTHHWARAGERDGCQPPNQIESPAD